MWCSPRRLELGCQRAAPGRCGRAPALDLTGVVEARDGRQLGEAIDVVVVTYPADRVHHVGLADQVSDAKAGQAEDLGERPQHDHIGSGHDVLGDGFGKLRIRDVLGVGLVHHDQHPVGNGVDQLSQLVGGHDPAGGVVGVAHEHDPGRVRDGRGQRVGVERPVAEGRHHRRGPGLDRVELVGGKRRRSHHSVGAGLQVGRAQVADDRVGTVTERHVRRRDAVGSGDSLG